MKVTLIGSPEITMHNPESSHNYFAWPTVTRLQNGKLAAVASGYRLGHLCPFGKMVVSYSEDEGKTWTAPAPVIDTLLDDRDGGILAFGKSGVMVTSFNNKVEFQRFYADKHNKLTKRGEYFRAYLSTVKPEDEEKYLGSTFRISNDCGVTFGPVYKCPVSSPHGPCELPDGTLLWVGWEFGKSFDNTGEHEFIQAYRINLDGTSEYVGDIEPIYIDGELARSEEPYAFALSDGTVICHIRVEDTKTPRQVFTIYQSVSKDGGKTWTKPEPINPDANGGAPSYIMRHSSGVLIATVSYRLAPYGIKAMFSHDNGNTWETGYDIYVNGVNGDLGYPATVELSDGSLLTVFYAHPDENSPAVIMQQKWRFDE